MNTYTPSFWEQQTVFTGIDVVIIGSGIVGLFSALSLKEREPRLKIMVIERGFLPYGASTRNAGFACYGSMTELMDDLSRETEEEVFARVSQRWQGLNKLRSIIGDQNMNYEPLGGYELFAQADSGIFSQCLEKLDWFNDKLFQITQIKNTYRLADDQIRSFGFERVEHLILNTGEGQIDTGKMMDVLETKVRNTGIRIINGLNVQSIQETGNSVDIVCENGFSFSAKKCLVANNGFAASLLDSIDVKPARAQVLITKPVSNLKARGSFHYEEGYYYFRNVGERILLGGGRNLDKEGETTVEFGLTGNIQNRLEQMLREVILPGVDHSVEMRWSGIMGMGPSKSTILKKLSQNITCAVRMGGMGVAIGSVIGEKAAKLLLED